MGGLEDRLQLVQTAMKLFDVGQGRMEMFIRISFRSTGWVHGSVWLPFPLARNLMNDLELAGYRVDVTGKYERYLDEQARA